MEYCSFALVDLFRKTYNDVNVYDRVRIMPLFCGGIARERAHEYCWFAVVRLVPTTCEWE